MMFVNVNVLMFLHISNITPNVNALTCIHILYNYFG